MSGEPLDATGQEDYLASEGLPFNVEKPESINQPAFLFPLYMRAVEKCVCLSSPHLMERLEEDTRRLLL